MPSKVRAPLTSQIKNPPNRQFAHFGVLDSGAQSKTSLFTSISLNIILMIFALIIGAAAKKTIDNRKKEIAYVVPLKEKPPEPIKPKVIPPKIPPVPKIKPPDIPKVVLPKVEVEPPKLPPTPVVQPPKPVPVMVAAPPKVEVAKAAPAPVKVNMAANAAVPNHDTVPRPVAAGSLSNPIAVSNAPAVANVKNLGNMGMQGIPPGGARGTPGATKVNMGSGQPGGSMTGTGAVAVKGVGLGCQGCTGQPGGNATGNSPRAVALGGVPPPPPPPSAATKSGPTRQPPQVLFKPKPVYTAEATQLHIEGTVSVKIRVSAAGVVTVLGVSSGLGHGLDESAVRAAQSIRFKPAVDANGAPVDWEGVVSIIFQMA